MNSRIKDTPTAWDRFLEKYWVIYLIVLLLAMLFAISLLFCHACPPPCDNSTLLKRIHELETVNEGIPDHIVDERREETKREERKDTIVDGVIVKQPTNNCRAHFSGLLMTDNFQPENHTEIYQLDESSEYVGEGEYPRSILAFPKAHYDTFDGIAIDKGTRVIIYSDENFNGKILMDETGPKIITNKIRMEDGNKSDVNNNQKIFKEPLNSNYPPSCRKMSSSNMFEWSKGSLKVICNE